MPKASKKRTYTRRKTTVVKRSSVVPFVVYVRFPSGSKEYCYLCDIPGLRQGDLVMANNTQVPVIRTAAFDPHATKWVRPVPSHEEVTRHARTVEIVTRLNTLVKEDEAMKRFAAIKTPEAKKLFAELKKLRQS